MRLKHLVDTCTKCVQKCATLSSKKRMRLAVTPYNLSLLPFVGLHSILLR